jgi:Ras-related protein Rab-7A
MRRNLVPLCFTAALKTMAASNKKKLLKVILVGDAGVGKTALLRNYVGKPAEATYKPTIGADFFVKHIDCDGAKVALQLWDTAGQERFQSLGPAFFRGADVGVLVFDVTSQESFDSLENYRAKMLDAAGADSLPFLVVGNKCDAEARDVAEEMAQSWCREVGAVYVEASALPDSNVDAVFAAVVDATRTEPFPADKPPKEEAKSSCC